MNGITHRPVWWVWRILASLALVLCLVPAGWAGDLAAPSPAIALAHRTEELQKALRSGDPAGLQSAIQNVELLRRTYGTLDLRPLVDAMALWARQQGDEGRPEIGLKAVQVVDRWAPKSPVILGTSIILQRQQGPLGYFFSLSEVMELTKLRMSHDSQRWLWLVQHLAWLRFMVTLLLWGWALAMAMRYRRVLRYLWEEPLLKRGLPSIPVAIVGACLMTLPVLVGLDPGLCAALWLWLLAPFLTSREVRIAVAVLLLQLVHPALGLMEPMAHREPPKSLVALQSQPIPGLLLQERMVKRLPVGDQTFLRGWAELQEQHWAEAQQTFAALVPSHPDRAEVLNNEGVACYQLGRFEEAQRLFNDAYRLRPVSPQVLFNQSVIAFRQLDSATGLAKQDEARNLDPVAFSDMNLASQSRSEQRTFAMPLPDTPARIGQAVKGYSIELPSHFLLVLVYPLVAVIALFWRVRRSLRRAHPSQCHRCGDPFHTTDSPDVFICSKCHHLFVLKDGLHGDSRKLKVDEVGRFQGAQRLIHRVLRVLLPGLDDAFLGDAGAGFAEFSLMAFALGIVLATGRSVRFPGEILADPVSTWVPVGVVLLVVIYLRSWLKFLPGKRS
nr:tetratricopeptide repeat protein [uncultured Holophaga sp.]